MKKGIVLLLAAIVGVGGVSRLSAQAKRGEGAERVNICVSDSIAGGSVPYTVPADRRLTIEDASLQMFLRTGEWAPGRLLTTAGSQIAAHTVAALAATHGNAYYSGARLMKIYADPGTLVSMDASRPGFQSASSSICFSGLLEPAQ